MELCLGLLACLSFVVCLSTLPKRCETANNNLNTDLGFSSWGYKYPVGRRHHLHHQPSSKAEKFFATLQKRFGTHSGHCRSRLSSTQPSPIRQVEASKNFASIIPKFFALYESWMSFFDSLLPTVHIRIDPNMNTYNNNWERKKSILWIIM